MARVSVLVSGGGANLQPVLDLYRERTLPSLDLVSVISSSAEAYAV